MPITLEVAAFDLPSAFVAAEAGADRIELYRDAAAGGLTPPLDWVEAVTHQVDVPVVVMVRSHADGWTFTPDEHVAMRRDGQRAIQAGASGVVWGALLSDGTIDESALRALVAAVAPAEVVFHRAFDAARDPNEALDTLLSCDVARVLTGGGPGPAHTHLDRLATLVHRADNALTVMPGGGVRAGNVAEIVRCTGAAEVHSGARLPGSPRADAGEVARLRTALDALS